MCVFVAEAAVSEERNEYLSHNPFQAPQNVGLGSGVKHPTKHFLLQQLKKNWLGKNKSKYVNSDLPNTQKLQKISYMKNFFTQEFLCRNS